MTGNSSSGETVEEGGREREKVEVCVCGGGVLVRKLPAMPITPEV